MQEVHKALKLYLENKNYNEVGMSWISLGFCHIYLQNFPEAINSCFKGLKYFRNDAAGKMGVAYANSALGYIYNRMENYPKAVQYYTRTLEQLEKNKNPSPGEMIDLENMNSQIGIAYMAMKAYDKAEKSFLKALAYSRPIGDQNAISAALENLGSIKVYQKQHQQALNFYQQALAAAQTDLHKANVYNGMGELYLEMRAYQKAIPLLQKAVSIAQKNNSLFVEQRAQLALYEALKGGRQFEKSLSAYEAYTKIVDSSKLAESRNVLKEQQLKFDFEKKELLNTINQQKKITALQSANEKERAQQNLIIYIFIGLALLLAAGMLFLYYYTKQRNIINANKTRELQQRLLLTQMNPHFIFNSVDNIQSLIHNKQDQEAIDYLTKFSKLTRQILENSRENYILLSEELAMLENYLFIQKMLHQNKFTYTINSENIDAESLLVPPMLTQPFIENAIKHGLQNTSESGHIEVKYYKEGETLYFEVTDNGVGLAVTEKNHKSLSTEITRERLFNISNKKEIAIHTQNRSSENPAKSGVRTYFEIPYLFNQ